MKNKQDSIIEIEPFIRNDQYNFIKFQINNLVHAHSIVTDKDVLTALKLSSLDKIMTLFLDISENQKSILKKVIENEKEIHPEVLLTELKNDVLPFKSVTEKTISKLFPKVKKWKAPSLEIDFREWSYLGWYDIRSKKKLLIVDDNGKLMGIQGTFTGNIKGICSLCNAHEEVGLFMSNVKTGKETYTNRGNYICIDSYKCNQNLMTLEKLISFVELFKN
ncbi:FusB/FusC family EF-G-binding protein [Halalkalibacter alkalisediminis]|uniref:FusB/FusC family EF-G-binding protein n=1 Tax=Halalkalibacter alkalisediminis TaxID=935616 RepID=A0ABV6NKM0_9BACI|nr:FusB/FusC family EF-G-binding protein [Halalkalibacter alkalisediminis]